MPIRSTNALQRSIVNGVPFWKDSEGVLYYYESSTPPSQESKIRIGTEAAGLDSGWKDTLSAALSSYRASAESRTRLPAKTTTPAA